MKLSKKIINMFEKQEFNVTQCDNNIFEFEKYSPAGQDFVFTVQGESYQELFENLYAYYSDFDVSYEAYIWLGSDGHGANGAGSRRFLFDSYDSPLSPKDNSNSG